MQWLLNVVEEIPRELLSGRMQGVVHRAEREYLRTPCREETAITEVVPGRVMPRTPEEKKKRRADHLVGVTVLRISERCVEDAKTGEGKTVTDPERVDVGMQIDAQCFLSLIGAH